MDQMFVFIDLANVPEKGQKWTVQKAEGYPGYGPGYLTSEGELVKLSSGDPDMIVTNTYSEAERICQNRGWAVV